MEPPNPQPTFATAINCIDGRVQLPVAEFARRQFKVEFVDMVTTAGAVANFHSDLIRQVGISLDAHQSRGLVVAAHEGCVGNPVSEERQRVQCLELAEKVAYAYPKIRIIPVWVSLDGRVETIA